MIKRMTMLSAALMMALTMSLSGVAFGAPADPHRDSQTGPSEDQTQPGTCVITTQQGANVTTTTKKGNCKNQGTEDSEPIEGKNPPGRDK